MSRKFDKLCHSTDKCRGFSLVELITVTILLGILSIFALGRFTDQSRLLARGYFDEFAGAMQFAQKLAISSGCDVQVDTTAAGYILRQRPTCTAGNFTDVGAVVVDNPTNRGEDYANFDIPEGFSLTVGEIVFDARGIPVPGFDGATPFTLSDGSVSYSLNVYGRTGLVDVQ